MARVNWEPSETILRAATNDPPSERRLIPPREERLSPPMRSKFHEGQVSVIASIVFDRGVRSQLALCNFSLMFLYLGTTHVEVLP